MAPGVGFDKIKKNNNNKKKKNILIFDFKFLHHGIEKVHVLPAASCADIGMLFR